MKHSLPLGLVSAENNGSTPVNSTGTNTTALNTIALNTTALNTTALNATAHNTTAHNTTAQPMPTRKTIFTISRGREILVVSATTISYKSK